MKLKSNKVKGITLIALVITIIVMLILVGVTINIAIGENGLIEKAQESAFVQQMKQYDETIQVYVASNVIVDENFSLSVGLEGQASIETVIPNIKKYKQEVIVQDNEMYYYYTSEYGSKKRVKWCFENNIKVWGYESYGEFLEDVVEIPSVEIEESEYKKTEGIYVNSPDISGFTPAATYYVTYDSNGENMSIYGRIDRVEAPEGWYDYANKKWANIVTVTENDVAYWVWIPRYVYKTDLQNQTVDAKFVDVNNECKNGTTDEMENIDGYQIPEAFSFGGKNLPGYWVSKYELSEIQQSTEIINCIGNDDNIRVSTNLPAGQYTIFVNGTYVYTGTLPYNITGVTANSTYDVCVYSHTKGMIGRKKVITTNMEISLEGFDQDNTYYVTWDGQGNEVLGNKISGTAPDDWYDYANKKWANIVTKANEKIAYWVWIPRYEYKTINQIQYTDVVFIPKTRTTAVNDGYQIPEAFSFGGKDLPGYWVSKYELSQI